MFVTGEYNLHGSIFLKPIFFFNSKLSFLKQIFLNGFDELNLPTFRLKTVKLIGLNM